MRTQNNMIFGPLLPFRTQKCMEKNFSMYELYAFVWPLHPWAVCGLYNNTRYSLKNVYLRVYSSSPLVHIEKKQQSDMISGWSWKIVIVCYVIIQGST